MSNMPASWVVFLLHCNMVKDKMPRNSNRARESLIIWQIHYNRNPLIYLWRQRSTAGNFPNGALSGTKLTLKDIKLYVNSLTTNSPGPHTHVFEQQVPSYQCSLGRCGTSTRRSLSGSRGFIALPHLLYTFCILSSDAVQPTKQPSAPAAMPSVPTVMSSVLWCTLFVRNYNPKQSLSRLSCFVT